MTSARFILRSLAHHRRINAAVALGVMAATAVLTGALLVGDSVRGSLQHLVLDRLGRIDHVLVSDRFFREALARELAAGPDFQASFSSATPAILLPSGTIEKKWNSQTAGRAANVLIVGCDDAFWSLGDQRHHPSKLPQDHEIILNEPLATELGARVGDEVVLRLPKANQVPADSPLGRKTDRVESLAGLKVIQIVPAEGLGRFGLRSSQHLPSNAYLSLAVLQQALDQDGKCNSLLVAGASTEQAATQLAELLRPSFEDFGLKIDRVRRVFPSAPSPGTPGEGRGEGIAREEVIFDYFQLTSDRLLLDPAVEETAHRALAGETIQPALTYLANSIELVRDEDGDSVRHPGIPYSTIAAIDSIRNLGPLLAADGQPLAPLGENEIVLNNWAASDLGAKPGDTIRIRYFEPETTHGDAIERAAEFKLQAIVSVTEPAVGYRPKRPAEFTERPTRANDPDLTPTVAGVTDQDSIDAWDPPFPYDPKRMRRQDDTYWHHHRTTPKAFVSLSAGRRLWRSRFGETTSLRIVPRDGLDAAALTRRFLEQRLQDRATLGFVFQPVKAVGIASASGTTPFDGLFLGLSFFLIAAALMLVALLFRLGIEQRAAEIGTLLALGLRRNLTSKMFAAEGAVVAAIGGLFGTAAGVGYAWLMLAGLRTWWLGAVSTPFLQLWITPRSLAIGYASGVATSVAMIVWSVRQTRQLPVRGLLAGQGLSSARVVARRPPAWLRAAIAGQFMLAVVLAIAAVFLNGEAKAGAFVGAGAVVLGGLLTWVWSRLRQFVGGVTGTDSQAACTSLFGLALRNAGRNTGRSTMTIGLMATASFLIIALSAFRLDPSQAGAGGFDLLAESSQPIFENLDTLSGRKNLLANSADALNGGHVFSLRLKPGDDASCNNLYQARQPRVLGVTAAFAKHFDDPQTPHFAWAGTAARSAPERNNPWQLLAQAASSTNVAVPVILDKNTAMYSLHLYGGVGQQFSITFDGGHAITFRIVGLLSNSILQGSLLIDEAAFVRNFPEVSGYRYFLVQSPAAKSADVAAALEEQLSDQGFDTKSTQRVLTDLLAVQNTYLSTFQSLGALGLLLGTFGLATVQLRNVLERRCELALLRAAGFSRGRLARLVLYEHAVLLLGGLLGGLLAALVAVLPHVLAGGASVPARDLALMLAAVLLAGFLSGLAAMRATVTAPLISALRGE